MDAGHTVGAADALARRVADAMYEQDDASRNLGIRLEAVGAGWARMSMPVTDNMLNGHRVCHGGYVFSLADSAMAFASNSRNRVSVAQFCSITFLRPGRPDQVLLAEAREQADAGRTGLYAVEVREEDGEIIAVFSGAVRRLGERTIVEGGLAFQPPPSKGPALGLRRFRPSGTAAHRCSRRMRPFSRVRAGEGALRCSGRIRGLPFGCRRVCRSSPKLTALRDEVSRQSGWSRVAGDGTVEIGEFQRMAFWRTRGWRGPCVEGIRRRPVPAYGPMW